MNLEENLKDTKEKDLKNFVHLHCHSNASLLDGESSPLRLATKAKALGMPALALTDHNHLLGVIDFKNACDSVGIKPIFGVELYYTDDTRIMSLPLDKQHEWAKQSAKADGITVPDKIKVKELNVLLKDYIYPTKSFHILFLAKNQIGYRHLCQLQSEAAKVCSVKKNRMTRFHCDNPMIEKYKEGLIMTTACLGSRPAQLILQEHFKEAEALILKWHAMFGEDFYLEIQPYHHINQVTVNKFYMQLSDKYHIQLIATNDVHYTDESDADDHDTILCLGIGKSKYDSNRMHYSTEFWLRSHEEMQDAFMMQNASFNHGEADYQKHYETAIANTLLLNQKISDKVQLTPDISLFPKIKLKSVLSPETYLCMKCYRNLYKYLKEHPEYNIKLYRQRLNHELQIINSKGFAPYMLINDENVTWCRQQNLPTGPGRGSAAGSLVLFLLGITKVIDPIQYDLLFSRFLTMDRKNMPDVDIDYSYERRGEVIAHLQNEYGIENVAHIGTISKIGIKSGLKDFGRVLGFSPSEMNLLTKAINEVTEEAPNFKFKDIDALKDGDSNEQARYKKYEELRTKYPELFRLTRKYEGTPRSLGVHASGILITPQPVSDFFPTRYENDTIITLFEGTELDNFNSLKLDVLGLKTLDIINNTIQSIHPNQTIYDWYKKVPLEKHKYFKLIQKQSDGIFQVESDLFKGIIKDMKPTNICDIIALVAIARPGPLSAGMHTLYNNRKNGKEKWGEPLPNTMDIVAETYGTIIYQEQCMRIAQRVAGFDDNHADTYFRKAMAKKKAALLKLCKQWFTYGKINQQPPADYDADNLNQPFYDPEGKYGAPILGGLHNGSCYDEKMLNDFFDSLKGYSSYLFNKSHAATYGLLTCMTAYLAQIYPAAYWTQVFNMEALDSKSADQSKIPHYMSVCRKLGLEVCTPNINTAQVNCHFEDNTIYFGLSSIQGINKAAHEIFANRPYQSLEDILNRIPKKILDKTVLTNLIKAGAFDFLTPNRYMLLNRMHQLRKDKDEILDPEAYTQEVCREFEKESLKTIVTYLPTWYMIKDNSECILTAQLKQLTERKDKKGKLMGFFTLACESITFEALAFSSYYVNFCLSLKVGNTYTFKGKKDANGKYLITGLTSREYAMN